MKTFWVLMKEGEERFEGLYAVLNYRNKQRVAGGDVYDPLVMENLYCFCEAVRRQHEAFCIWVDQLFRLAKAIPRDTTAQQRVLDVWYCYGLIRDAIGKRVWFSYASPAANNPQF